MFARIKKKPLLLLLFLCIIFEAQAEIKLPALISSNMVLQRNSLVKLWGWAEAGEKIEIKCSWLVENTVVTANDQGEWEVKVSTGDSKEEQRIEFKGATSEVVVNNILLGEVWVCSGQSNMEMPIKGFRGQPTFESTDAIRGAANSNIRLFTVERTASKTEEKDIENFRPWESANPSNVSKFSAIAYFYADQLEELLDVPVGIIHSSWGGSIIEAWISEEVLSGIQEINPRALNLERGNREQRVLYNGMISPLLNYTIRGVLWYQGESNRNAPAEYLNLFTAMVKDWRQRWDLGDFPFYYVQIAPFDYDGSNTAYLREAQMDALKEIPNTGMVSTMDIGAKKFIHPPKKKEVANRLVNIALSNLYDFDVLDDSGPLYESYEVQDSGVLISFSKAENGLWSNGPLKDFEIAGEDRVFYPAEATITERRYLFVKSDKVVNPVAVRYAWRNWVEGSLFDASLLPASSFRTDKWPIINEDTE